MPRKKEDDRTKFKDEVIAFRAGPEVVAALAEVVALTQAENAADGRPGELSAPIYLRWSILRDRDVLRARAAARGLSVPTTSTTTPAPAPSAPRADARQRDLFSGAPAPVAAPVVVAPVVAEPAPVVAAEPATTSTKGPKGKRPASSTTSTKGPAKGKATPAAEPATVDADAVRRVLVARYEAGEVKLAELAAACGARNEQVSRFKKGEGFPVARLAALAAALGMTP